MCGRARCVLRREQILQAAGVGDNATFVNEDQCTVEWMVCLYQVSLLTFCGGLVAQIRQWRTWGREGMRLCCFAIRLAVRMTASTSGK